MTQILHVQTAEAMLTLRACLRHHLRSTKAMWKKSHTDLVTELRDQLASWTATNPSYPFRVELRQALGLMASYVIDQYVEDISSKAARETGAYDEDDLYPDEVKVEYIGDGRRHHLNALIFRSMIAATLVPSNPEAWGAADALAVAINELATHHPDDWRYQAACWLAEIREQRGMTNSVGENDSLPRCIDVWVRG